MKCRINKSEPNAAQRKALERQVETEFNKLLDKFIRDVNIQVYYIMHFQEGKGMRALKNFAVGFNKLTAELKERYEMGNEDLVWLCEHKLKEDGIDVDELLKEVE